MSGAALSPLVSVIMPARNAARTIAAAIYSVQAQAFLDLELFIIDVGSTDDTADVVSQTAAADQRIRWLSSRATSGESCDGASGPAETRNRGLAVARGRYIAFLDADDYWQSDKLQRQLAVLRESGAAFCYSSYVIFRDGDREGRVFRVPATTSFAAMLSGSVIGCSTVLYDRDLLGIQVFDDGVTALKNSVWRFFFDRVGHEDYVAWMRLLALIDRKHLVPAQGIREPLVFYRVSKGSVSAQKWRVAAYQFFNYAVMLQLRGWRLWGSFGSYAWQGVAKRWHLREVVALPERLYP